MLIFDFDGTLADTSPLHEAAFNSVLAPWGISADYPAIAGLRTRDALAACFTKAGVAISTAAIQDLTVSKQSKVRASLKHELRPLPGVDEFLRMARQRFRLALYSSGSRDTVLVALEQLGYVGWFAPMLCADDVMNTKPHPEGFIKVLAIAGINATDALVFEDSDAGIEAARRAGLETVDVRMTRFGDLIAASGQRMSD